MPGATTITSPESRDERASPQEVVQHYLRGRNLEQLGRLDDAISLYETAVSAAFDSAGPYDRLITLYSNQARHMDVIRVAKAALANVQTHQEKRAWYERMRMEAEKAKTLVPPAVARRRGS